MRWFQLTACFCICAMPVHAEEVFYSIAQYLAIGSGVFEGQESTDDVFDTVGIATRLKNVKKVRLLRMPSAENESLKYWDLERKPPLKDLVSTFPAVVELQRDEFSPLITLSSDFSNYGSMTMCAFEPGVALLIGDADEPDFVLICCFKCHDIHVVRRPTKMHPMPHVSSLGMSPELEKAIFDLAKGSFPNDKELQAYQLPVHTRSTSLPPKPVEPDLGGKNR